MTPGIAVTFTVKVANPKKRAGTIWIGIDQTDWFETNPSYIETSWKQPSGQQWPHRLLIGKPPLKPGTSTITLKALFATPFEPHYSVYIGVVDPGGDPVINLDAPPAGTRLFPDLWTSSSIC